MTDSPAEPWATTTHSWTHGVDLAHLEEARQLVAPAGPERLTHMILEVVAYADDEAEDQHRTGHVLVTITEDQIVISDDGRGTDTRRDATGAVVRKPVMATRDVRFFGRDDAPLLPDGLRRQGMSSVAAVCEELTHENRRREGAWSQTYEFGVPSSDLTELTEWSGTGTTVRLARLDRQTVGLLDLSRLRDLVSGFSHVSVSVQME